MLIYQNYHCWTTNVGKSTLLNALTMKKEILLPTLQELRAIPFTHITIYTERILLIDTAGIRKKNKVHEDLEFYSVILAIKVN
ncbi:MAG: 50S ribosome-binding GTPase [Saprospirales bacterium]|nr:50S ribosome-binding GTPase [Saprospirales bacterium]